MNTYFNPKYPATDDLKQQARKRIPAFAFNYLEEGCNDDIGVHKNRADIDNVELRGEYLKPFKGTDITTELFGHSYNAPFGIAPVGLQGLMWPKAPEILAKSAADLNIPYVLSTVSSSSLERIAEISEGKAWFQFYNPTHSGIRKNLIDRIIAAQYPVMMVTVDVSTFGYRPRDIRNGLAMPPKMSLSNIIQMLSRLHWLLETALAGKPEMQTLKPYMPKNMPTSELADFMNNTVMGDVDVEKLKAVRDHWPGPLVIKGLINEADVERAIELGAEGVIISNHGARQLDVGETPVKPLQRIAEKYKDKIKIMMDSGLQSGPNIACALASGADFTFLGRPFVYGVGALGRNGGYHTINMLRTQLLQVMSQVRCHCVADLPQHLVRS